MRYDANENAATEVRRKTKNKDAGSQAQGKIKDGKGDAEASGEPGPEHDVLDAFSGNWAAEVKSWNEPNGKPAISRGTAKVRWILNGRFLEEEFQGEMMGKPFIGRTIMGFDTAKKIFNIVWISDVQTSIFTAEGKGEDDTKVITLLGKSTCPTTGAEKMVRTVYRLVGEDEHVMEMYDQGSQETKTLEVKYTRK